VNVRATDTLPMSLSIIIVNWNSKEHLRKCLASVRHDRHVVAEIVVIDGGSNDGCDQMLRERYPEARFIQSPCNVGFAAANNRAFLAATGDTLLFLNPDTEIPAGAIGALLCHMQSLPDAGVVGCRLLNSDGSLQSSCIQPRPTLANQLLDCDFLRKRWPRSRLWGTAPLLEAGDAPREVDAVSGACLMVRRRVFEQVGGFSEDYFMYAEDIDLAHKVTAAGYRNYCVPDVNVTHHGGNSSDQAGSTFSAVMRPEAIWRFLGKTRGHGYALAYRSGMAAAAVVRLAILTLSFPFAPASPESVRRRASYRKWRAVLRWALHQDETVKRYYGAAPASPVRGTDRIRDFHDIHTGHVRLP
jgi:N-acetylglucosaminyl-diphospho-decaprenol L-rhamnosyltransferase